MLVIQPIKNLEILYFYFDEVWCFSSDVECAKSYWGGKLCEQTYLKEGEEIVSEDFDYAVEYLESRNKLGAVPDNVEICYKEQYEEEQIKQASSA